MFQISNLMSSCVLCPKGEWRGEEEEVEGKRRRERGRGGEGERRMKEEDIDMRGVWLCV